MLSAAEGRLTHTLQADLLHLPEDSSHTPELLPLRPLMTLRPDHPYSLSRNICLLFRQRAQPDEGARAERRGGEGREPTHLKSVGKYPQNLPLRRSSFGTRRARSLSSLGQCVNGLPTKLYSGDLASKPRRAPGLQSLTSRGFQACADAQEVRRDPKETLARRYLHESRTRERQRDTKKRRGDR